jgi:para-aminobenzoate synthetase
VAVHDALARFGVGGAITALSDPESEYVETVVKASGVVEAIALLDEVSA